MQATRLFLCPSASGTANAATAFPRPLRQFAFPAGKEWSRHDRDHADISRRTGPNPGARPMTPCTPLTLTSPPPQSAAGPRDHGKATVVRPAQTEPSKDLSGLSLPHAAARLCVLP